MYNVILYRNLYVQLQMMKPSYHLWYENNAKFVCLCFSENSEIKKYAIDVHDILSGRRSNK